MQMASRLLEMAKDMEKVLKQAKRDIRGPRKDAIFAIPAVPSDKSELRP